jgi:small-conductance mechanosensitive channel
MKFYHSPKTTIKNQMKITIEKPALETIKTLRAQLAARLKTLTDATGDLDRLTEEEAKLRHEIATLEANLNEATSSKLAGKRELLAQVQRKIEKLSHTDATVSTAELTADTELLKEFARQAAAATAPGVTAYAKEVADKIRPFCLSDEQALQFSFQVPAVASLMGTYRCPFGSYGFSIAVIKSAIARADEILAGELNWSWQSGK